MVEQLITPPVCPICKEPILLHHALRKSPTVYLHGFPLHALILFSSSTGQIKAVEGCHSIEILRTGSTLATLMKKFHTDAEDD